MSERATLRGLGRTSRWLRLIPPGVPGKARLARALLGRRLPEGEERVADRIGLSYRVPDLHDPVAFHLLVDGVYEPKALEVLLALLPERGTLVDVGAGIGAWALPGACRVGEYGHVLALEASELLVQYLRANAAVNGLANVTAIHTSSCDVDRLIADTNVRRANVVRIGIAGLAEAAIGSAARLIESDDPPVFLFEFSAQADAHHPAGAQQFLMDRGYTLWRLSDYRRRRPPLTTPLTMGMTTIVARRV